MFMERIKDIDIAKGIGILLVIIGHSFPESYIQRLCYCFHMPLFFFISGLCYNHLNTTLGNYLEYVHVNY